MFDMTDCKSGSQHNSRTGFESRTMKKSFLLTRECFFCPCFSFLCFQSERNLAGCVGKGIISAYFFTRQIVMDVQTQACQTVQSNTHV